MQLSLIFLPDKQFCRHPSPSCIYVSDSIRIYDKLAPTKDLALQTPSFVRMRWVDLVSGSTHAASRLSRVVKPCSMSASTPVHFHIRRWSVAHWLDSLENLLLWVELSFGRGVYPDQQDRGYDNDDRTYSRTSRLRSRSSLPAGNQLEEGQIRLHRPPCPPWRRHKAAWRTT